MKILFLCMGNICRSPAAHCVFQHLVDQAQLSDHFEIDSAGTIGYHQDSPPDERMQASLRQRGFPIIGRSRPLVARDLETFDLILAMDRSNYIDARSLTQDAALRAKVQMFSDYCRTNRGSDVPDPYYGGGNGFERVLDMVEDGCTQLLEQFQPDA